MASYTTSFVDYPDPKEGDDLSYTWKEDKNPAARGLTLVAISSLVSNVGAINKFIWHNTGFTSATRIPGLGDEVVVLKPRVIPVSDPTAKTVPPILPFGPAITDPQRLDLEKRYYSAADYHALYKSGKATPVDVLEALLPLVQRGQSSPYELAFLTTDVDSVREAAKASAERWAAGKPLGLLDGVPFTVKCDIDVAGYVTTTGMNTHPGDEAFGKRFPFLRTKATKSAWPVQQLLEAGGLLVAQNNMHEIGLDTTGCNPGNGTPINWFNESYYPGGSSSGAGSALGAGLIPIALGTDAGGSTRIPPSFNGVYGFKTTHDRTMVMDTSMCVISPMAGTVADLTAAYRTIAKADISNTVQAHFAVSQPPAPGAPKVLGVPREWVARADEPVRKAFENTLAYLKEKAGYTIVDIQIPHLDKGQSAHAATCLAESLDKARDRTMPYPEKWSALLSPANRLLLSVAQNAGATDYLKFGQLRARLMRHLAFLFQKYPGLLIITPTLPFAGWPRTPGDERYGFSDGNISLRAMLYVWLANSTGCPAVTCPMGYVDPAQGEGKLPVGFMAVGEWGAEESLLAFAADEEAYLHDVYPEGRQRPEKWVDVLDLAKKHAENKA